MYIMNMCGSLDIITTTCIILSLVISPLSATPKGTLIMPCGPSGHVSISSSLVGQPWIMCFQPGTEKLQRLITSHVFSHRNGLEMEKSCTKLNSSSWSVGNGFLPLPTNNVIVTCPGPRMNTMCLKSFNGSTNDIGRWKFTIVDNIYGNREELCSTFLNLKKRDFPRLKWEVTYQSSNLNRVLGQSLALILSIGILSISAIAGLILYKKGKCAKCASFFQQLIKKQHNEQQPDNEQQPGNEQQPDNEQQPGNEQQLHNDLLLKRKQRMSQWLTMMQKIRSQDLIFWAT